MKQEVQKRYLRDFMQEREERARALGIFSPEVRLAMMNPGTNRTPEKRLMLARIQERARAVGLTPFPANF